MALGIKVWNASGNVILDSTDSITRVIDVFSISSSTASGSRTYTNLPAGRVWFQYYAPTGGDYLPSITISGNVVSWVYNSSFRTNANVILGVF